NLQDGSWSNDELYETVAYTGTVTTTITDATDPDNPPEEPDTGVTLKLFAKLEDGTLTDANTIAEQNDAGTADITATYVVLAVDAAGNPLAAGDQPGGTVTVNVGDAGDTASTADYNSAASRTETVGTEFTITSADDALADSGETFSLDLADGSWSEDATYENVAYEGDVTTTITDASDPTDPPE
ncbi:MAG: hypothetical protein GY833_00775, partial [Aestuariibacter sp.]|nr:hypothetical protein [Aestuariibacter sp.]